MGLYEEIREGRLGNALALGGDEGRGKLREAAGIGKHELIRRYPNGVTRQAGGLSPGDGSEPAELKHLSRRRKRKQQ